MGLDFVGSLGHACEAETSEGRSLARIEAAAIVFDFKGDAFAGVS